VPALEANLGDSGGHGFQAPRQCCEAVPLHDLAHAFALGCCAPRLHRVAKADDLVKALGADTGISNSEVSRICRDLDEQVAAFADRPLAETPFPYVFLDATYCKARVGGARNGKAPGWPPRRSWWPPVSPPTAAARSLGSRSATLRTARSGPAFLRSLKTRGLAGTKLVISDAHAGLKAAIAAVMLGAGRQRCRVHFLRNLLAQVPKGSAEMVAAAVRTIFAQPDAAHVRDQLEVIATMLGRQFPKVETMLREATDDVTAFADFPVQHWKKIWSTNPLERVNKKIKRRTDVVGVFPNPMALLRLAGCVLIEVHDEWQIAERRDLSEGSMSLIDAPPTDNNNQEVATPELVAS
jgi:putative transposase